jgi:O-antigen ligase
MNPQIATLGCFVLIAGLFWLNRSANYRPSLALWIPTTWLLIGGSRNIGEWLHMGGPENWGDRYLEGNPIDRAILSGIVLVALVVLAGRGNRVAGVVAQNWAIVLFFVYCGISILWSDYPFVAFKRWNRAIGDLAMVLIVVTEGDWVESLKTLLTRTSFILIPSSILLIRYFPELGRTYSGYEGRVLNTGVSTDKNGLGMLCLVFGLGSAWCLLSALRNKECPSRRGRIIAHGMVVMMVISLVIQADSATSATCLILASGLLVLGSLFRMEKHPFVLGAITLTAVGVPLYALFLDHSGGMVAAVGRDPTLTGRTAVWELVVKYVPSAIFGAGFESFWLGERLNSILRILPGLNQAHNGYIEIYLNLGWVGVFLLAMILVVGFHKIVIVAVKRDAAVGMLLMAYFLVAVVYNLTEAGFKMMSPVWIMLLLSIVASEQIRLKAPVKAQSAKAPNLSKQTRYALAPNS